VRPFAGEQHQWVVQPLLDAGVHLEEIRDLVFGLAFTDVVSEGRDTLAALTGLVADRPGPVRLAWAQTIARLQVLQLPA
jgi:hypothetical protein